MAFVPVPMTIQAEVRMLLDDQRVENTLYFHFLDVYTVTDIENLGDQLITWWTDNYAPIVTNAVLLREIYLTDLTSATAPAVTRVPATPTFGGSGSATLPANVSFCVSFRTASRGRSFRGRNYIVGLIQSSVTLNTLAEEYVSDIIAAYNDLPAIALAADTEWVVVSRFTNNAPRVTGIFTPITTVVAVDNTIDSQRRRLPGRGT